MARTEKILLRISEAAEVLGISRSHLYAAIQRGDVPVIRIGRTARIPAAWLNRWVNEQVAAWEEAAASRDEHKNKRPRAAGAGEVAYVQENSIIEHLFWQCPSLPLPGEVDQVNGWVCVHRKLLDSPIFSNPKTLKVFLWCLLKATHQDYEAMVGRQRVALKPGQFITGRAKAAESLDMPPSTAWEYLKLLESNESIQICSTSTHSIITVVNWAAYQGYSTSDSKSDRDSNSEETPFEQSLSKDSGASSDRDSDSKPDSGSTADRHIQPYKHRTKDIICVLTEAEEAFLNTLSQVENYPLDRKRDLEMYRNLAERYPELDLCEAIEQWRVYKLDKPLTERSNPRSQIDMSFKKYTEWGRCLKKSPVKEDWRCQKTLAEKTAHY